MPRDLYEDEIEPSSKDLLKWGMLSSAERKEVEKRTKAKRKKLAKGWKPEEH